MRPVELSGSYEALNRQGGVNEAGLAIANTFVPNDGPQPGVMFGLATRWVLDTCSTVAEATEFLEELPHARNTNFVVADAAGAVAVVKASPDGVRTTTPDGGIAVTMNHFTTDEMRAFEPADADRSNSVRRYGTLADWIERRDDPIDADGLQTTLADPTTEVCACATAEASDPVETLWWWTATLEAPSIQLSAGRPDETPYESVDLSV